MDNLKYALFCLLSLILGTQLAAANVFSVVNSGASAYIINGASNPTLTLYRGRAYVFNINASGHPFWIKTNAVTGTGSAYTNGVTGNGTQVGTLIFTVPMNAPTTLHYICQFHGSMSGVLNIQDSPQFGWWRFELVGSTAHDYSGRSLDGTITNMNTGLDDGVSGYSTDVPGSRIVFDTHTNDNYYSLRFRKSGGHVRITDPTRFKLTNNPANFTVEAFVKVASPSYPMRIVDVRLNLPEPPPRTLISPFLSDFDPKPLMGLSVHSDATTNYVTQFASPAVNPSPIAPRHWHHVAYVLNNTSVLFFVDYQLVSVSSLSSSYSGGTFTNITQISIGTIVSDPSNNFDGWLDEVRITDRALAPTQFLRVVGGLAPGIRSFTNAESPVHMTLITETGVPYRVQGTTNLLALPQVWTNVTDIFTGHQFYTTLSVTGAPARFYRVLRNP